VWLVQDNHENAIGKNLLAISTTLCPVALMDPGIDFLLKEWNKDKSEHKTKS
jgi:hypothetical protein